MTWCDAPGFDDIYGTDDGAYVTYTLPRTGKDFIVGEYLDDGFVEHIFTWDGMNHHFSKTVSRKVEE